MDTQEANRIIAEFMGWEFVRRDHELQGDVWRNKEDGVYSSKYRYNYDQVPEGYSESLDALVPVWEKLTTARIDINMQGGIRPIAFLTIYNMVPKHKQDESLWGDDHYEIQRDTIQEAAAIATAKAIQELN